MRLVIDTNIIVSGFLWNGAPARLIAFVVGQGISVCTSDALLDELEATLSKPKLAKPLALAHQTPNALRGMYQQMCSLVTPAPLQAIAPDPDDDWVIATAIAAKADLIVTGDKPFLGVGQVGDIRIVTVAQALALLADA